MGMPKATRGGGKATVAVGGICCVLLLGGCTVSPPPGPATSSSTGSAEASAAFAEVGRIPGVAEAHLSYSAERFGQLSAIAGSLRLTPEADPLDVLDRALYVLYRDTTVFSFAVSTARDDLLWDSDGLGLPNGVDRARLAARYGPVVPGRAFPTPPPPRPTPAPPPRRNPNATPS